MGTRNGAEIEVMDNALIDFENGDSRAQLDDGEENIYAIAGIAYDGLDI